MPAALVHLDGAQRVLDDDSFPPLLADAARAHLWCYRLGALLPDLPLFEGFTKKVVLFLAGRPYPESLWGTLVHSRGAGRWAGALLGEAGRGRRADLRALLAGFLTHVAFDRAMHPTVEEAVRERLSSSVSHSQLHEKIENYQCLQWHRSKHGVDGLGTTMMRRISLGPEGSPEIPAAVATSIRASMRAAFQEEPSPRRLSSWARGLAGYRRLLSTPAAKLSVRASERFGLEAPWVKVLIDEEGFEAGLRRSLEYARMAAAGLEAEDATPLAALVGDDPLV